MNDLAFIASVVGSLAIPITVVVVVVIFRGPLTELLGRIVSYEGLGQKVNFGRKLAQAEKTSAQAQDDAEQAQPGSTDGQLAAVDQSSGKAALSHQGTQGIDLEKSGFLGLAALATSNPSFVIIKGWEDLRSQLKEFTRTVYPDKKTRNPLILLPDLVNEKYVQQSFADAVMELFDLRNNVAHGLHNPTAGEAVAYLQSVERLISICAFVMGQVSVEKAVKKIRAQEQADKPQQ